MSARVTTGRGTSTQNYSTPKEFMVAVERLFGPIHHDVAASRENTKGPSYFDEAKDGLAQAWHDIGQQGAKRCLLWCNPPFSHIDEWAKKCAEEAALGAEILLLVPIATSKWFGFHVACAVVDIYLLEGRMSFIEGDGYPKDLMLVHYHHRPTPSRRVFLWAWRTDKPCHQI